VAQDGQVLQPNAAPVVLDLQVLQAAFLDNNSDVLGPSIQGVLDHLLEGRGRPLHDLASSDPVHDRVVQALDSWGRGWCLCAGPLCCWCCHGADVAEGKTALGLARITAGSSAVDSELLLSSQALQAGHPGRPLLVLVWMW
jgi:hypothetical protein